MGKRLTIADGIVRELLGESVRRSNFFPNKHRLREGTVHDSGMDSRLSVIQPPSLELLAKVEPFSTRLAREQLPLARRHAPRILQVNLGKLCNQVCRHCHVDAGPHRTEVMSREIMQDCLDVLDASESYQTVDLTGGAPELNPNFCWFVEQIHARGKQVIDRCNLTVLLLPRFADLMIF